MIQTYGGGSKPAHKSLTVQGLLVLLTGLLLDRFGLPLDEQFLEEVVPLVLEIVGLGMAAYGRVRAEQPLGLPGGGGKGAALGLVLLLSCTSLAACGGKNLAANETARVSVAALAHAYKGADAIYVELRDQSALAPDKLQNIALMLQKAKSPVAALVRLAALESSAADYAEALSQAKEQGSPPPVFEQYVPPEVVREAFNLVAQAAGSSSVELPQGEQAVLAFLSSQMGNIYPLAAAAVNQLAQGVAIAQEAAHVQ